MSGVGSTNAMKKGSANNPFLAYSEADMQGFLNSAYTGCIVKYTGPSINRTFSEQNLTIPEAVQNLVFTRDVRGPWASFDSGNLKIQIAEKTNEGTNTWYLVAGQYVNGGWNFSHYYAFNGDIVLTDSLSAHPTSIRKLWTIKDKWNNDYINDQGNLTFWTYDEDVIFTIAPIDTDSPVIYDKTTAITIVPYKVNELYKVVYADNKYYYEKFCHISDTPTTANSDYMAPGKTAFDFTGNLQTGNGSKVNPYLAYTVAELQSFPIGSFIKWLGPNKTILDATTGQMLIQNEIYRAVEEGDVFQYVILPTLSNPGTAADLAQGKQLIDGEGKVVEGTAKLSTVDIVTGTILPDTDGVKSIIIAGISRRPKIIAAYQNGIVSSDRIAAIISDPDCANEGSTSNSMWVISGTNTSSVKRYWATFDYDEVNQTVTLNAERHLLFMRYQLPYAIAF